jgi:homotetrameric NADPH-dependent glutamate synthase
VDALQEAERCIQCVRPTCIEGCPVQIDIPRFIRHLLVRDLPAALATIQETNLFASICGRVCPQESQCEAQCILVKGKMESVAIGRLERFVGDNAPAFVMEKPANAGVLGKVAIVGSGPAGLACAGDLAKAGAQVTIYEALHVIGGVLRYGIPSFRLPRTTIDREVKNLQSLGVTFETNKVIGKTFTIPQLFGEMGYDAVFVGTGAGAPSFLGIPGEFAGSVYSANEFLTRVNLMGGDRFPYEDTPVTPGRRVVVLGAGNTAMDCLRVSRRLGAAEVKCVYRRTEAEAPARIEEIRHAKEEGITFHWLRSPLRIETDDAGDVKAIVTQVMELGPPDKSGRRRPVPVEGETETFLCDTVIYALGTKANPVIARSTPGLDTREEGYINADPKTQAANLPGVFAGGDIVTGGATVILALGAGRRAAKAIAQYLKTKEWPVVLADEPAAAPKKKDKAVEEAPAVKLCPKCRQPLEGDEEYVCCAGLELTWTCDSCQKVYEGFAFPYGLCPACGGTLSHGHEVDLASAKATEALRHAFEIELGGLAFYARGAEETKDPVLKKLFSELSVMERGHMETLSRRYHVPEPPTEAPGISSARVAVYADAERKTETGEDLLKLAVHLERRARQFFLERGKELEPGSSEWKLYREMEAEEREHTDLLTTALVRYTAGKAVLV